MAKFCGNCGNSLDDDAVVCGYCGTRFEDAPPAFGGQPQGKIENIPGVVSEHDKKRKQLIITIGAGVLALLVLIFAIKGISSSSGYKGTVSKFITALQNDDPDKIMSLSGEVFEAYYELESYLSYDLDTMIEKAVSEALDEYEDDVGNKLKLSYEIVKTHDYSDRQVKQLKEELEDEGYDINIKAVKLVTLDITAKGSSGKKTYHDEELLLIKEGRKWKICLVDPDYIM